jgi:hypothetical protein
MRERKVTGDALAEGGYAMRALGQEGPAWYPRPDLLGGAIAHVMTSRTASHRPAFIGRGRVAHPFQEAVEKAAGTLPGLLQAPGSFKDLACLG